MEAFAINNNNNNQNNNQNQDNSTLTASTSNSSPNSPMRNKIERQLVTLSGHLTDSLFHENEEVVLEAARALGEGKHIE